MGHVSGPGRSPTHELKVGAVKEKISFSCSEETLMFQHKYKTAHLIDRPYLPAGEFGETVTSGQVGEHKSSGSVVEAPCFGSLSCDGYYDELVKHMSNLPGFLQRVEKENSIQEKALNFGVLEWKRLEKWKYTERMPRNSTKKTSSSSSNYISTSGPPKISPNLRNQSTLHDRIPGSFYPGRQSLPRGTLFSSTPRQLPSHDCLHLNPPKERRSVSHYNDGKFGSPVKLIGKETCDLDYDAAQSSIIGRQQDDFDQRLQSDNRSSETNGDESKNMNVKEDAMPGQEVLSPELGKHKSSVSAANKIMFPRETSEMQSDNNLNCTTECSHAEPQNIMLPLPSHFGDNNCLESIQFVESRTSVDLQFSEVAGYRLSESCSTGEVDSGEFSPARSHSCPLPSFTTVPIVQHDMVTSTQASGLDTCTRECRRVNPSALAQRNSTDISVKYRKARPGVHSCIDDIAKDKGTPGGRARSSPLRRLLDPLLKHKGPESAEMVRPMNKSLYSATARTTGTKRVSQDRKPEASVLQALLQLTWNNGRPCFKLVVNNGEDMLAAGVKSLQSSGKGDPCMIYTFYSVHEIRKKSMNWITQGSKSKNCSLGYDIIGQMKISSVYDTGGSSECQAIECVLYGISPGHATNQAAFAPSREIAAIIVKSSIKKFEPDCGSGDTLTSSTVILPAGTHGIPIKGAPSSLISRWKSGGLCDCGGWDVGCKLRVLADHSKSNNVRHASTFSSDDNRLLLFLEGGKLTSKHAFSLEPLSNGLYSVEFDTSISLTEAFAAGVAYVTCLNFSEITRGHADAENVPQASKEIDERRTSTNVQEQQNMSHPCPPLSPAGRI